MMKGKIAATAMSLLLLLLLTFGAEADRCEAGSRTYKGRCNNNNCWAVCMTEGNTGGFCKRMGTKCMCTRECGGGGGGPKPPPGGGGDRDPPVLAGGNNQALLGRRGDHAR
ncbi:defensin J1-2-like [Panicum virgatum]|nr:defensin J1-2-like [Panicum virgatum]